MAPFLPGALLLGLLTAAQAQVDVFVRDDIITDPSPAHFTVCHGNGCAELAHVSLSGEQWQEIRRQFEPPPADAGAEREGLRRAIALMERFVGAATSTWRDRGGTLNGGSGQMDCIDESINTTLYLMMFQKEGLLRWHEVEARATRGWFLFGWPHTTAVVRERGGQLWAVDAWFLDNGEPPFILPLEIWRAGWQPAR